MEDDFDIDKFLLRVELEFGNCIIINSLHCFNCFKAGIDRYLALLPWEFEYEGKKYEWMGFPLCRVCYNRLIKTSSYNKEKIVLAMEKFPFEILKK